MNKRFPKLFKTNTLEYSKDGVFFLGISWYFQRTFMSTSKVLWPSYSISEYFSKEIVINCTSTQSYNAYHNMVLIAKIESTLNIQK